MKLPLCFSPFAPRSLALSSSRMSGVSRASQGSRASRALLVSRASLASLALFALASASLGCGGVSESTSSGGGGAGGTTSTGGTGAGGSGAGGSSTGGSATGGSGTGGSGACAGYQGQSTPTAIAASPYPDEEAEILAIEASGEVVAPQHVYARILADLDAIRAAQPAVQNISVMGSWMPDALLLGLDAEGFAAVQAGTYTDWDCPNTYYGKSGQQVSSFVLLEFSHRFNAPLLAAEYAQLPHVEYAEPNGFAGDGSDVCVSIESDTKYNYVFDLGSGDCPAGCIDHTYWGFSTEGTPVTVTSLGTFSSSAGPPPAWFNALSACTKWL